MKPIRIFLFTALLFVSFVGDAQTVLWATAYDGGGGGGTLIRSDSSGSNFYAAHIFNNISTGVYPLGYLLYATNGKIYGLTDYGGNLNGGVAYSYDPANGAYSVIHHYINDTQNGNGNEAGFIEGNNGLLYGVCQYGGAYGFGIIYTIDPATNNFQVIHSFNDTTGASPLGNMLMVNGIMYGMTTVGGANAWGVIYSFDPLTNNYSKLYDFDCTTGCNPIRSEFIKATNGKLYGMTSQGGVYGYGVIFSFDLTNNSFTKLHEFDGYNGWGAIGRLLQASNGLLYGMTHRGGTLNHGTIFSYNIDSNIYTKLVNFVDTNGAFPYGGLIQAANGHLIGTNDAFGLYPWGTIFSYDITNNALSILLNLDWYNDGGYPWCDVLETPAIPTALQTFSSNKTFTVYPNPAINSITINGCQSPVEFVDVYGRIIKTLVTDVRAITTVDITQFPDVFFVRNGDGLVKKIVRL